MRRLVLWSAVLAIVTTPALAQKVLKAEPPEGALATGKRVLVDDGSCPSGQILQVIGGDKVKRIARQRLCVARR
jgi:hypothetical protein